MNTRAVDCSRVEAELRPKRAPSVAAVRFEDSLILGHEGFHRVVRLDAVTAQLWWAFDGSVSLAELAGDMEVALEMSLDRAEALLTKLVWALAGDGFLQEPACPPHSPRRTFPWIAPESCVGRRMGYSRAEFVQARTSRGWVRIGASAPGICAPLVEAHETMEADRQFLETLMLRVTASPHGRPRLQQLFGSQGQVLYAGHSYTDAVDAFQRTVAAALAHPEYVTLLQGPVLVRDGSALILGNAFVGSLVELLPALEECGVRWAPGGLLRLEGGQIIAWDNPVNPGSPPRYQVRGVVLYDNDRVGLSHPDLRSALDIARRWDQTHFDAICTLAERVDMIAWSPVQSSEELVDLIDQRLRQ